MTALRDRLCSSSVCLLPLHSNARFFHIKINALRQEIESVLLLCSICGRMRSGSEPHCSLQINMVAWCRLHGVQPTCMKASATVDPDLPLCAVIACYSVPAAVLSSSLSNAKIALRS